jgi:arylsulfatase A-like enzyme
MGGCIDNWSHFFYWNGPNRHDLWRDGKEIWEDGRFFPELMIEESERFITENKNDPFYIYWAINVPHYPLQGTDKWREVYKDLPEPRKMYAAFVSTMDEMIGRLFELLEESGLTEDTIVIFQSDHGHSTEERTFGGGGSAGPYRGAKFSLFEGGIRVPAIISWPGKIPQDQVRDQFATSVDWYPTIAELCDISLPKRKIDGKSLLPIIRSDAAPDRHNTFYWETGTQRSPQWAVRSGDWKLLGNPKDTSNQAKLTEADQRFLVNLASDKGEKTNLAADYPTKVNQLEALYKSWKKTASNQ